MERESLSCVLIAAAVILAAVGVCFLVETMETLAARGGELLLVHSGTRLAIVCGAVAILTLGAGLLLRIERRERRPRPGQCPCGYPLDDGMGKCPECGRVRWRW